jgi:hypothetical protein
MCVISKKKNRILVADKENNSYLCGLKFVYGYE